MEPEKMVVKNFAFLQGEPKNMPIDYFREK